MKRLMVRYTVKPGTVADNERYIRAVYAELARDKPAGIRYTTWKLADGVSFVHVASIETADGANPLLGVTAFQEFTKTIKERLTEPVVTTELEEVGAYRFWDR